MSYTNRISDLPHSLIQQTNPVQKPAADSNLAGTATSKAEAHHPVAATDQTHLSTASTLLSQALSVSDVRTEKVAALQQAIAAGSYHVSSADVADKLVQSLLG